MREAEVLEGDVTVVGGGPVGLSLALELGRRGIRTLVVERREEVSAARPRAKTTSVRTMEHFRRLGIADRIRAAASLPVAWSQDVVFCRTLFGEELFRFTGVLGMSTSRVDDRAEASQQIAQHVVEEVLRAAVAEEPSCTLLLGATFLGLQQRDDGVRLTLSGTDGGALEVESAYIVGCDGHRSAVRSAIGAELEGASGGRPNLNFVLDAPGLMERHPHGPAVHYWVVNREQAGVLGPLDLHGRWWGSANDVEAGTKRADLTRILRSMVGEDVPATVLSTDPWQAQMRKATALRAGRVLLAGEAGHVNPPWGGHGYNTGVGDAVDLGWKLAATVQGWGGPDLLDAYAIEREPIHQQVTDESVANMRTLASDLAAATTADGELTARIREAKAPEFYSLDFVLGTSYAASPLVLGDEEVTVDGRSARTGGRLPHRWLEDGRSVYDALGPGFTVVHGAAPGAAGAIADAMRVRGVPVTTLSLPGYTPGTVVVRPDQHIAWAGSEDLDDPAALVDRIRGAGTVRAPSAPRPQALGDRAAS